MIRVLSKERARQRTLACQKKKIPALEFRADAGLTGSASTMKNVLPETAEGESLCFVTTIKVRGLNGTWVGCRI